MHKQIQFKFYLIWIIAAVFYMYQFILRVSPSVMLDHLMLNFHVGATEVAALSAIAMYAYSIMQIPSGVLVDIFGTRRIVLGSILLCVAGILLFVSTDTIWIAKLGRAFIGVGSAAAFLSVCKVSATWFPVERRGILLGMTMAMGTVGAMNGSTTLSYVVENLGWKQSLMAIAALGIVVFFIALSILPKSSSRTGFSVQTGRVDRKEELKQVLQVFRSPLCWANALAALGIYLCISVIGDLWGVSFLVQKYGMNKLDAAKSASLIYAGLCVGSLTLTWVSDRIRDRKKMIIGSAVSLLLLVYILLFTQDLSLNATQWVIFFIGFFSGAEMLCFASATESMSNQVSGTVTGFVNCVVMTGGAVLQEQVGRLLDQVWVGGIGQDGVRIYTADEYQLALSSLLVVIGLSVIAAFFIQSKTPSEFRVAAH